MHASQERQLKKDLRSPRSVPYSTHREKEYIQDTQFPREPVNSRGSHSVRPSTSGASLRKLRHALESHDLTILNGPISSNEIPGISSASAAVLLFPKDLEIHLRGTNATIVGPLRGQEAGHQGPDDTTSDILL
jgi:hypothetical protein